MTALPWLERAGAIRFSGQKTITAGTIGPGYRQYLAAHYLTVDRAAFQSVNKMAGAELLAAAHEFSCDLLVMGAYSHSRLRQSVLGGVTRHVLEHATVPLLMHR